MSVPAEGSRYTGVGRTVACPTCGARIYTHCVKADGTRTSGPHAARVREAHRVDVGPQMARDLGAKR